MNGCSEGGCAQGEREADDPLWQPRKGTGERERRRRVNSVLSGPLTWKKTQKRFEIGRP